MMLLSIRKLIRSGSHFFIRHSIYLFRFQLFGDTVNYASRMYSTGSAGKVQLSHDSAQLLIDSGRSNWVVPRSDPVDVKGKGRVNTHWLNLIHLSSTKMLEHSSHSTGT